MPICGAFGSLKNGQGKPSLIHALRHFLAFGEALVDRFGAWVGDVARKDVDQIEDPLFNRMRDDPSGAMILSAHIGSIDIVRALASRHQKRPLNVVLHTEHAEKFGKAVARFAPNSKVRLISAADFNMGTAMSLSEAVERGEWVVFMADRTPINSGGRTISVDFLGAPAAWPLGPFSLVRALKCPTYVLLCYRRQNRRVVRFAKLADKADLENMDRKSIIPTLIAKYVRILENILTEVPYQWFNFYDFWAAGPEASKEPKRAWGELSGGFCWGYDCIGACAA